jgi:hypothetical protein
MAVPRLLESRHLSSASQLFGPSLRPIGRRRDGDDDDDESDVIVFVLLTYSRHWAIVYSVEQM